MIAFLVLLSLLIFYPVSVDYVRTPTYMYMYLEKVVRDTPSVPTAATTASFSASDATVKDSAREQRDLPNIVFVMADDLGYGDVRYNGGKPDTPNIDAMAAGPNSIQLTRYYAGGPMCSPTRGTVLTGRNHNRYCIWQANPGNCTHCNKTGDFLPSTMPLPTSEITVAEILKQHGYHTAVFGKWHLGDLKKIPGGHKKWPISNPSMHGFDTWWVTERKTPTVNPNCGCFADAQCKTGHWTDKIPCINYHHTVASGAPMLESYPIPIEGDDSHFILSLFADFLEEASRKNTQPFFVYLPFHAVHTWYVATRKHRERFLHQGYNLDQADYYGAITAMDDAVGQIRELLKQYNISHNTMLWFTSDNGPKYSTPGETAGLRGFKKSCFEGGIRVPAIIEWPDMVKDNRVSDFPVVSSDLLPTVCDILGINPPQDRPIDGTTILPFIRGETSSRNSLIAWLFNAEEGFNSTYQAAIAGNQYKLFTEYSNGKVHEAYLYDLVKDPFEQHDVSAVRPALFLAMKVELEKWRQSVIHSARDEVKCY